MDNQDYDERQVIEQVSSRLRDRFPDREPAAVDAVSAEVVHEFANARIKNYVGPLAEHRARDVLKHSTASELAS